MSPKEQNYDEWKEIRARVDSMSSRIFIIPGGALSLSLSIILGNLNNKLITQDNDHIIIYSWYCLLGSIIAFIILKSHLIFQAFVLQMHTKSSDKHNNKLNNIGFGIGLIGLLLFIAGLFLMVHAAAITITQEQVVTLPSKQ